MVIKFGRLLPLMSTISRVAALFSTAALGSMLLTTSVSSVTTIVAAAETNQTQQTNALTLADGTYDTTVAVYKTGTQEDSAMMSYVESKGSMTIKNGSVTLDIAMKGQSQMDMMTGFTVAGHAATKSGTHWTVTLPVSEWAAPFATSMVIDVPAISWHEEPSADLMVTPIVPDKPADTNDTDSDAILSADVPMAASDSMDRFFNPTAKLAVKGDTTDVTLSFKDSVSNMLSMIPEVTFDGITQPLNGKNDITFNIPTKDLKPTNGKSVTLASFTSVPMSPTKGYKSDLTFDLTNVLPAKDLTTGSYKLAVSADGGMDKWFDTNFQTDLGWLTSKVTVAYQESKQGMLSMIPTVTFDNITKPVNGERFVTFEIPTKDLSPDDTNIAKIASFTSVPMSPSKGYQSNLSFDMTPALGSSSETQPEAPAQPEQPTDPETPSVPTTPETPSNPATPQPGQQQLANGTYTVPFANYKTGTNNASAMNNYLKTPATVTVNGKLAHIDIATSSQAIMDMMSDYKFNGEAAKRQGTHWLVTLPTEALYKTITTSMTISMNGQVIEKPTADMVFDTSNAVATGDKGGSDEKGGAGKPEAKPETDTDESTSNKTGKPAKNAVVRALKILRADNDEASIATQYFHTTIKLAKNADGSYYGYLTTHTPKLMGKNPIRFTDKKHDVSLVETKLVNNYYESTYQMKLQKSELTKPIATTIHVQFTEPIPYNENYEIRLVIGKVLSDKGSDLPTGADKNGTPSGTESNTSQSDVSHETTLTDVNDRTNATTPTTSMGVTGVGTTMPSPIANVPGTAATTTLATTPATQTTATPTTATSLPVAVAAQTATQPVSTTDKPAKSTNKAKHASNSSQSKTAKDTPATKQANTHDDKQPSSIKRAALIGAGVALTAAIGFIGTTMAVNFFKIR